MNLQQICGGLHAAYETLSLQSAQKKNAALKSVINSLKKNQAEILAANELDVKNAKANGTPETESP